MPDLVFVGSNILVYAHDRSNPVGILYSSRTGGSAKTILSPHA
jgi:hypothetical protein